MLDWSLPAPACVRRKKGIRKGNRRAVPCARRSFPLLALRPACQGPFLEPQPVVSVVCCKNNILCCFPAQETLYCVRARLSIRFLVIFCVTFHERAATPCHALWKKIKAISVRFCRRGRRNFSGKPVDFFAANDYDESYGELFISAIMRERSVPFSWTATLTVTRPGTGAPPLRPPVCCARNPPRAPFPAHPAGKD